MGAVAGTALEPPPAEHLGAASAPPDPFPTPSFSKLRTLGTTVVQQTQLLLNCSVAFSRAPQLSPMLKVNGVRAKSAF